MIPRAYIIESQTAVASPTKTAITATATTAVRTAITDFGMGSSASPADNALTWYLQRFTAPGTNSAYTPPPLDSGDPACTTVGGTNNTIEPTYTANKILFHMALNQRSGFRWNWDVTRCPQAPATSSNGIGAYAVHGSFTGNVDAYIVFVE
jgi:hypothetical protein